MSVFRGLKYIDFGLGEVEIEACKMACRVFEA